MSGMEYKLLSDQMPLSSAQKPKFKKFLLYKSFMRLVLFANCVTRVFNFYVFCCGTNLHPSDSFWLF